ncbi:HIT family protein [Methylophilus sp. OH31]|uniref:HIT family protein n=1 Tax=Methylophilus sp. OH31 TaxID=1387312 RepID=UPI0004642A75|nr:HIT family protein [Methylophilus sp. OH31]
MSQCPLCLPTSQDLLWQDDFCRVVLLHDADYPAYCRVELLAHLKEMTDLPPADRARTMKVVFAVETAVREVIQPDKINLASLGNKTPHMHWHVLPRFESDRHFPNSHWGEFMRDSEVQPLSTEIRDQLQKIVVERVECALKS